jgi:hypothetical protein
MFEVWKKRMEKFVRDSRDHLEGYMMCILLYFNNESFTGVFHFLFCWISYIGLMVLWKQVPNHRTNGR